MTDAAAVQAASSDLPSGPAPSVSSARPLTGRLEYRLGLDLMFSAILARSSEAAPLAVIASTPALCYEAALRARTGDTVFCDLGDEPVNTVLDVPDHEILRPIRELPETASRFGAVIWFAPQPETWDTRLSGIERVLAPTGLLATLTAGRGNILTPLRRGWESGEPAWQAGLLAQRLAQRGFRERRQINMTGLDATFWVLLQRVCALARRADLADRCEVAYRLAIAGPMSRLLPQFTCTLYARDASQ